MMRPARMVLAALALLLSITIAAPAGAQTPYPVGPTIGTCTGDGTFTVGETVSLCGTGWPPGASIDLSVGGQSIGTATADASGAWSFDWSTTGVAAGTYSVTATDGTSTIATQVSLAAAGAATTAPGQAATPAPAATGGLPRTGSDSGNLLRAGGALILGGGILVLLARRRHTAEA